MKGARTGSGPIGPSAMTSEVIERMIPDVLNPEKARRELPGGPT